MQAAINIAKHTQPDPYSGLAEPELLAQQTPDLSLDHAWDLDSDQAIELAEPSEQAAVEVPGIVNSEGGDVSTRRSVRVHYNSHGLQTAGQSSQHSLSAVVLAQDEQGDAADSAAFSPLIHNLNSPARSARSGRAHLGANEHGSVATGQYPVVFDLKSSQGLIGTLSGALNGNSIWRQSSWAMDLMGQCCCLSGPGCGNFPADGSEWIGGYRRGQRSDPRAVLCRRQGGVVDFGYAARRLDLTTTGNAGGTHNLWSRQPTEASRNCWRRPDQGLLITEMME